jgi:hypothetical protein
MEQQVFSELLEKKHNLLRVLDAKVPRSDPSGRLFQHGRIDE